MTYEDARRLQQSVERLRATEAELGLVTWTSEGEDPQLVGRAEEYIAARLEHADLLAKLVS